MSDHQNYNPDYCAESVWEEGRGCRNHQCTRRPGHGPDKKYCRQHAKQYGDLGDEAVVKIWFARVRCGAVEFGTAEVIEKTTYFEPTGDSVAIMGYARRYDKRTNEDWFRSEKAAINYIVNRLRAAKRAAEHEAKSMERLLVTWTKKAQASRAKKK